MAIDPYYKSRLARNMIRQGRSLMERIFAVHNLKRIDGVDNWTLRHMRRVAIYAIFDRWLENHRPEPHKWSVNDRLEDKKRAATRQPILKKES